MSKQSPDVHSAAFSLRDWFAGQALSGLVARGMSVELAVATAYQISDAMLKERGR